MEYTRTQVKCPITKEYLRTSFGVVINFIGIFFRLLFEA
jgi:hypothetical protein